MTGQGDDYTTGCLLNYAYFKNWHKNISINLNEQQAFGADPKAMQETNFTEIFYRRYNNFSYYERSKRNYFNFLKRNSENIFIFDLI